MSGKCVLMHSPVGLKNDNSIVGLDDDSGIPNFDSITQNVGKKNHS